MTLIDSPAMQAPEPEGGWIPWGDDELVEPEAERSCRGDPDRTEAVRTPPPLRFEVPDRPLDGSSAELQMVPLPLVETAHGSSPAAGRPPLSVDVPCRSLNSPSAAILLSPRLALPNRIRGSPSAPSLVSPRVSEMRREAADGTPPRAAAGPSDALEQGEVRPWASGASTPTMRWCPSPAKLNELRALDACESPRLGSLGGSPRDR